jgi:hypothetical protein
MMICIYLAFLVVMLYWLGLETRYEFNLLKFRDHSGPHLEDWLKRFNWDRSSLSQDCGELPHYKFYTEIVEILLSLARKMGGRYQEPLLFLRQGLQADLQSEKKIKELYLGTTLQIGLMVMITWGFILGASFLVEIKMKGALLLGIMIWQLIGVISLPWIIRYCRKILFQDIGKLWKVLFVLKSLSKVPLSRTEILKISGAGDLEKITQKNLGPLVEKLLFICQKSREQGINSDEELSALMKELRFIENWHFELFEKRLVTVKLCLMAFFFLPSYLAFIFNLLGDLLALM